MGFMGLLMDDYKLKKALAFNFPGICQTLGL